MVLHPVILESIGELGMRFSVSGKEEFKKEKKLKVQFAIISGSVMSVCDCLNYNMIHFDL